MRLPWVKMMVGMKIIKPTGDIDRDFVEMMVPHHQGAVDMAQAELRYGHDKRLRRLARQIVTTQQQEVAFMRLVVREATSAAPRSPATVEKRANIGVCLPISEKIWPWCIE
jgi:hypothetical protein